MTFELRPKGQERGHMEKGEKGLLAEVTAGAKATRMERVACSLEKAPVS